MRVGGGMHKEQFDELVGKIYDAVVDPDLWPLFLERFTDVFGGRGTVIYLVDYADRRTLCRSDDISFIRHVRFDPDYILSFDRHYASVNVWFERAEEVPESVPVTSSLLYPDTELPKTEWHNDWLRPQGYFYALTGNILKQGTLAVRLASFRSPRQGAFSPDELASYGRLMPHLRRACKIHQKFAELQFRRGAETEILNRLPIGVALFDRSGRAVFLNRTAEDMARRADGFRLDPAGRCRAETPAEAQALRKLIEEASGSGRGGRVRRGGVMALARRSSERPLSVMAAPLPGNAVPLIGDTPSAVLFLCAPDSTIEPAEGLLARLYGLSAAEARLAAALVGGKSLNGYAEARGVSRNTVRTQLKQVLAKTGVRRQAELVKLLLTGPTLFGPTPLNPVDDG
jgi:DNA-binding CsgD family transcriptional regulator